MSSPAERAQRLLAETAHFEALGLGDLAHLARDVARDTLDLAAALELARSAEQAAKRRHEDYVAYHQRHCFNPDGTTRSGIAAEPFAA